MKSKLSVLVAVLALVFVAAACNKQASNSPTTADNMQKKETMQKSDDFMKKDGAMEKDKMMDKGDAMMKKSGEYKDYSAETVAAEQKASHKVVLYFYAPWCPFCRAADADFKAHGDKIPSGVALLKTSYDDETALKEKYGVTYQHTFVQIDNNGNLVTKWISGDTDLLAKNVK